MEPGELVQNLFGFAKVAHCSLFCKTCVARFFLLLSFGSHLDKTRAKQTRERELEKKDLLASASQIQMQKHR